MAHCSKCGTPLPNGAGFCPTCGARIVAAPQQPQQPYYPQPQYGYQPQQPYYPQPQYGYQPQPYYPQPYYQQPYDMYSMYMPYYLMTVAMINAMNGNAQMPAAPAALPYPQQPAEQQAEAIAVEEDGTPAAAYEYAEAEAKAKPKKKGRVNVCAVIGYILSFLLPPIGLILSIIGLALSKKYENKSGREVAIAGIIIGIVMTIAAAALVYLFWGDIVKLLPFLAAKTPAAK